MEDLDLHYLTKAKELLEKPGLTARIATKIGTPIEKSMKVLPEKWQTTLHKAAEKSIHAAFTIASSTVPEKVDEYHSANNLAHKLMVAGTGGLGGLLGPAALLVELPVSTTLIMRSIIDIAQSEGEDLSNPETKLACMEVFAFGGYSASDDATGSGYLMTRAALAKAFTDAAKVIAGKSVASESAPVMVRFLASIASRFNLVLSEKVAAQILPIVGAVGGAGINLIFMDHFQDMARGHFVVRRLERKYGVDYVRQKYLEIKI
ncbi:EcsC family protein [Bdellovibrio bacteriovorus]|uniref:EcsC family protein n=1 Tax=Bdellovibrio bacteriovorus TaxID=959 RepID=UPI0035A58CF0